jgi:hypothetical protein
MLRQYWDVLKPRSEQLQPPPLAAVSFYVAPASCRLFLCADASASRASHQSNPLLSRTARSPLAPQLTTFTFYFSQVNPNFIQRASHSHQNKQPNSLRGSPKLTMTQKSFFRACLNFLLHF